MCRVDLSVEAGGLHVSRVAGGGQRLAIGKNPCLVDLLHDPLIRDLLLNSLLGLIRGGGRTRVDGLAVRRAGVGIASRRPQSAQERE